MLSRLTMITAWLLFVFGSSRVGLGLFLAFGTENAVENTAVSQRHLAAENINDAINSGMLVLCTGIALGVLAQISPTLKRQNKRAKEG